MMVVDIGNKIRVARLASGSTLRALAERAGTSHSALAAYESNAKMPRADTMYRVLEAAGWRVVVMQADELSWDDRVSRGKELKAVLDLAAHFPRGYHPTLRARPFAMVA